VYLTSPPTEGIPLEFCNAGYGAQNTRTMPLPDQCDDVYIGLYAVLTLVGQTDGQTDRRTSLTKQYRALHALHADAREKARARVFCYARICYILQKDHCNTVQFYVGAIAVIWAIMWFFLVYNSPDTHPRISREERQYIEKTLNKKTGAKVENTLFSGTFTRTSFARFCCYLRHTVEP